MIGRSESCAWKRRPGTFECRAGLPAVRFFHFCFCEILDNIASDCYIVPRDGREAINTNWTDGDKAGQRIRELWNDDHVAFADHAVDVMEERGLTLDDIGECVRYGDVKWGEEMEHCWRFGIHGRTVDGLHLKVVIDVTHMLIIVSAFTRD